jgi:hypothetical protein
MADEEDEDEEFSGDPPTPAEMRKWRRFMREEEHAEWFWKVFRRWVGWAGGAAVALYAAWEKIIHAMSDFAKFFSPGGHP